MEKLEPKSARKKRNVPADYHVLFQSGCDFGVEKKCGKKVSKLIVLVSKEQYYIYDPMYTLLYPQNLCSFYNWTINFLAERRNVTKKTLFRDLIGLENGRKETLLLESFEAFQYLCDMYGAEWGKAAVEKYMSSPVEDRIDGRQLERLFSLFEPFDRKNTVKRLPADKTLEYMIYHSCREGYAFSMAEFLSDWIQCLQKQNEIYGKIEDKYPAHLKSALKKWAKAKGLIMPETPLLPANANDFMGNDGVLELHFD